MPTHLSCRSWFSHTLRETLSDTWGQVRASVTRSSLYVSSLAFVTLLILRVTGDVLINIWLHTREALWTGQTVMQCTAHSRYSTHACGMINQVMISGCRVPRKQRQLLKWAVEKPGILSALLDGEMGVVWSVSGQKAGTWWESLRWAWKRGMGLSKNERKRVWEQFLKCAKQLLQ